VRGLPRVADNELKMVNALDRERIPGDVVRDGADQLVEVRLRHGMSIKP
jgi:hypothetical protein